MLTASPSPSPKPEEHLQDGGDVSVDGATLDDTAPKEPQESDADHVERAWGTVLNTMHVCVKTSPPPKPELLEEQESWLCDWNVAMADMTAIYERARAIALHVSLNDLDAVTLAKGKTTARMLTKAVRSWKEKAEKTAVTACPARAEKGKAKEVAVTVEAKEKVTEKAEAAVVTDMGRPRLGGRMTIDSALKLAEECVHCATSSAKCVVMDSNARCNPCMKTRKGCSFVTSKTKERALAAPKLKIPPVA
ncbi:uncharacterized protein HD556DRAFT_1442135 [Suillus plorans]|uniref:Uncharacterized protein n=1 Tax=Suillus plorans TaxID=116603 RepID=A0A9P7DJM8_9AGAM|nr:uncharacterized protein HD556DRAFT_1442135 [Suillus plorans]KAG1795813.1 hypothetical protein HD556DRAFT_1442135 [Suillus plorans]